MDLNNKSRLIPIDLSRFDINNHDTDIEFEKDLNQMIKDNYEDIKEQIKVQTEEKVKYIIRIEETILSVDELEKIVCNEPE